MVTLTVSRMLMDFYSAYALQSQQSAESPYLANNLAGGQNSGAGLNGLGTLQSLGLMSPSRSNGPMGPGGNGPQDNNNHNAFSQQLP
ncbi:hypothetical protein N0V83_008096 [Neocucurbitaria cava]|uniref:Uncharacterized protein n=1 Tax=Neocucurbitaria cava TaxID=798079 RepID=A0A9W8Y619_9PLEO|nr:hypothetical protein N0V83_008096 [Neocucurbitaria cava]